VPAHDVLGGPDPGRGGLCIVHESARTWLKAVSDDLKAESWIERGLRVFLEPRAVENEKERQ
jgi:hypothetical protein